MLRPTQRMALMILSLCPLWATGTAWSNGTTPVTVVFQNGTTSFATGTTGSANYLVSKDASAPPALSLSLSSPPDYSWVSQVTTGTSACTPPAAPVCSNPFTLEPGGSCCLMLSLNGTNLKVGSYALLPVVATKNATYQYTVVSPTAVTVSAAQPATLTVSTPLIALSVNHTTLNKALTGNPRHFTITNTGPSTATGLAVSAPSPALPTATTSATTCGATLAPNATCTLTITPGINASEGAGLASCSTGIAPIPSVFSISAHNATTVTASVDVLTYGCVYQYGFVYSVDDSTFNTGSIGGKVAALVSQKPAFNNGIVWDADTNCATYPFACLKQTNAWDFYDGQNLSMVPGSTNPNNNGSDGPGNTYQIFSVLNGNNGNTNNPANYAASVCSTYAAGDYTNWYLPAICEMGPASNGVNCTAGYQNMVSNLSFLLSDTVPCTSPSGCLAGYYWSSTENSEAPQVGALFQNFSGGSSSQRTYFKSGLLGVRCSRALTA